MKFFPYENFIITTELLPADVIDRIEDEIEPPREINFKVLFSKSETKGYFSGFILNGKFSLTPAISYRNSFLPHITGSVMSYSKGSIIQAKMTLNTTVLIFMCIWLGGVSLACIGIIIQCIIDLSFNPVMLIPFGMFAFGYGLMTGGFKFESGDARNKLLSITQGVIEE